MVAVAFALNVSNVPGPLQPVTVLGARLRALHSLAEINERHALRVSIISVAETRCFGFCADAELVADEQTMARQIEPESRARLAAVAYR
jgi:hypothetical protein